MSKEIYQIAWLLVNRISTRVPAMKAKQFGELLWWIDYYSDSEEDLARKQIRSEKLAKQLPITRAQVS